jgi:hypothetical protein
MNSNFLLIYVLLLTAAKSALIRTQQSQINDPAKARTLADCANKSLDGAWNFCCDLKVNDMMNLTKKVCVSLKQKNNLEPMATMRGYPGYACKLDLRFRVYCRTSLTSNRDLVRWESSSFIRVLNPRNKERSLEACALNNFNKCW